MSVFMLLCTAVIVGGIDMMSQALMLAKKPHIIIGKLKGAGKYSEPSLALTLYKTALHVGSGPDSQTVTA